MNDAKNIQSLLQKHGIIPKKRLGQHFLKSLHTIERIVSGLDLTKNDVILEIGPGLGVMTALIAHECKKVIAVDRDASALKTAKEEFCSVENIEWIESDILKFDLLKFIEKDSLTSGRSFTLKIAGNLPYNISSQIMFWMLDYRDLISRAVVMLQKEVADRIVSRPGTRDYGILSVLIQSYCRCEKLFDVSPGNFIPPPKVTSSVIEIDFGKKIEDVDYEMLRKIVKSAFSKRRKTLKNSLANSAPLYLPVKIVERLLDESHIDSTRRPETLSIEEYILLAKLISQLL